MPAVTFGSFLHRVTGIVLCADECFQGICRGGHFSHVLVLERTLCGFGCFVDLLFLLFIRTFANFFTVVQQIFQPILYLCIRPGLGIFCGVLLSLPHRPVNLFPTHIAGTLYGNLLPFSGIPIHGRDVDNAVDVNGKGDFDLRYAPRCTADPVEPEPSQAFILASHGPFALQHMDFYRGLETGRCGKDLALRDGNGGISLDEAGTHAAHCFNPQRKGSDVQKQQPFYSTCQDTALQARAQGNTFIRVDALEGFFPVNDLTAS